MSPIFLRILVENKLAKATDKYRNDKVTKPSFPQPSSSKSKVSTLLAELKATNNEKKLVEQRVAYPKFL